MKNLKQRLRSKPKSYQIVGRVRHVSGGSVNGTPIDFMSVEFPEAPGSSAVIERMPMKIRFKDGDKVRFTVSKA
jgi:hypothetical protein